MQYPMSITPSVGLPLAAAANPCTVVAFGKEGVKQEVHIQQPLAGFFSELTGVAVPSFLQPHEVIAVANTLTEWASNHDVCYCDCSIHRLDWEDVGHLVSRFNELAATHASATVS